MPNVAWAESPLQVLNAVEWAVEAGEPCTVVVRAGVPSLVSIREWLSPRLEGRDATVTVTEAADPFRAGMAKAGRWVVGDAFSGQMRVLLSVARGRRVVVVDDGTATLHLARILHREEPFGRMGQREGLPQRALGATARSRLVAAARRGRLELFTAYGNVPAVSGLAAQGVAVTPNEYGWIRGLGAVGDQAVGTHVIIGSALAADGYIDHATYERWVTAAAGPGATYLPHRRERRESLDRLAATGLVMGGGTLPVELVLAGAAGLRHVTSLPSSTVATLARLLPPGVTHRVDPVPPEWWKPAADAAMREALSATTSRSTHAHD